VGEGNSSPLYGETELRALHPFACRAKGWRRSEDRGAYDEDRLSFFAFRFAASCENVSVSRSASSQLDSARALGAIRNIRVPTHEVGPIHLQKHGRRPDSIFLDLGEVQSQTHRYPWALEVTEVASRNLQKSDLPFGRTLVRQSLRSQYAVSVSLTAGIVVIDG
jgi:hypothetical protein